MHAHLRERRYVEQRRDDHRAGDHRGIEPADQSLQRHDRGVLGAVTSRDQREHWAGLGSVDHRDREIRRRIGCGGDRDHAGRRLSAVSDRRADGDRGVRILLSGSRCGRQEQRKGSER